MTNGIDVVIPDYTSVAGQRFPLGSLKRNDLRLCICNTNVLECLEYVKILENEGFIKCVERIMPSNCVQEKRVAYGYD